MSNKKIKQLNQTIADLLTLLEEKRKLRSQLDFEIEVLTKSRDRLKRYKRTLINN